MLKYTTNDAIALRLSKRLQVGGSPQTFGKDVVDISLINLVGPQCEARFESAIAQLYQVPLNLNDANTRALAASIVEKMILAEILPVHVMPDTGAEGGLRKVMANEWINELAQVKTETVRLKGERLPSSASGITPLNNTTQVSQRGRVPGAAERIDW